MKLFLQEILPPTPASLLGELRNIGWECFQPCKSEGQMSAVAFFQKTKYHLRFGEAIINDKLISRATLEEMIRDTGLKTEGNPYGLGWYIYGQADSPAGRIIEHSGSQMGTSAQLGIFLDANLVVAGFSNTTDSWGDLVQLVFQLPNP